MVQDAFVYAFRNLERYDAGQGSFWTWLRVILVSRCRNKRRRQRLPRVSLEVLKEVGLMPADPKPTSNPAHVLESSETRRMIWEALHQVSPGARILWVVAMKLMPVRIDEKPVMNTPTAAAITWVLE